MRRRSKSGEKERGVRVGRDSGEREWGVRVIKEEEGEE